MIKFNHFLFQTNPVPGPYFGDEQGFQEVLEILDRSPKMLSNKIK